MNRLGGKKIELGLYDKRERKPLGRDILRKIKIQDWNIFPILLKFHERIEVFGYTRVASQKSGHYSFWGGWKAQRRNWIIEELLKELN